MWQKIVEYITSIFGRILCNDELQRKKRWNKKVDRKFHKNQWLRLFSTENDNFFTFLKKYKRKNEWHIAGNLSETDLNFEIFYKDTNIRLFRYKNTDMGTKYKINDCLYPVFQKEMKKYCRKNNISK